jgi:hypothetical protein
MPRRAAKVDRNQPEIVAAFRRAGWSVQHLHGVGAGCPDLCVAGKRAGVDVMALVEVKMARGKLTPDQIAWRASWVGPAYIVRSVDDVIALIEGRLEPWE